MTAQARDIIIYEGEKHGMSSEPLSPYLSQLNERPVFVAPTSACWRGYISTWELRANELFLIDFKGTVEGYKEVGMEYIFPDQKEVFAEWFTDIIIIPQGELLKYEHGGYGSIYEEDLFLEFNNGVLIRKWVVNNYDKVINSESEPYIPF